MGSLRAKQASYIEILKAIQLGQLQGLARPDRLLASQIWNTLNKQEYDADLKLYLPFDEASGATAHDLSGNGNTGTVIGATIVDGVFGKARSFNGVDEIVTVGAFPVSGAFTYKAWVYPTNATANHDGIISNHYIASPCYGVAMSVGLSGTLEVHAGDGVGNRPPHDWGSAVLPNTVTHVVVVYSGTAFQPYINGKIFGAPWTATVAQNNTTWCVGRWSPYYDSYWYEGWIDEARVYSRALSADEIYLHYLAGALKLGLI